MSAEHAEPTQSPPPTSEPRPPGSPPTETTAGGTLVRIVGDWAFLVAAVVLAATALGWKVAQDHLGLVLIKEAIPWPSEPVRLEIDEDGYRLLTFPTVFDDGRYRRAEDDELPGPDGYDEDSLPDGENIHKDDVVQTLGMGTSSGSAATRDCNWYVSRTYIDTDQAAQHRLWMLDVTYYTGTRDAVPHVPERCLTAGGARLEGTEYITIDGVKAPEAFADWRGELTLCRTTYLVERDTGSMRMVQYHVFSYNGEPIADWKQVRLKLRWPFTKYAYFAKIQFAPRDRVYNVEQTDQAAAAFFCTVLPDVLDTLPTPQTVENLNKGVARSGAFESPVQSAATGP